MHQRSAERRIELTRFLQREDRLGPVGYAQYPVDSGQVGFNRSFRQVQFVSDDLV